jgi:hypothetical protein
MWWLQVCSHTISSEEAELLYLMECIIYLYTVGMLRGCGIPLEYLCLLSLNFRTYWLVMKLKNDKARSEIERLLIAEGQKANKVQDLKHKLQNAKDGFTGKRQKSKLDHRHALLCVQQDYWGNGPTFNDLEFNCMFGITQEYAEKIIDVCVCNEPRHFDKEG